MYSSVTIDIQIQIFYEYFASSLGLCHVLSLLRQAGLLAHPETMIHSPGGMLMLSRRCRRRANISPASGEPICSLAQIMTI